MTSDDKIKHLEFIQTIIARMANNSFLIKGWSVTIAAAFFALAARDSDQIFSVLAIFPIFVFWYLDAYYLRQERLFRQLYNKVRTGKDVEPFSLSTGAHAHEIEGAFRTMLRESILLFHCVLLIATLIVSSYLYYHGPSRVLQLPLRERYLESQPGEKQLDHPWRRGGGFLERLP